MSEHALLPPSGASRWIACTPSARLEQLFEDSSGTAAEEGTLAHAISEILMKRKLDRVNLKDFNARLDLLKSHPLYDKEILDICEDYTVYLMERYNEARSRNPDAEIFLETKIDLTKFIPEGFGTGDVFLPTDDILDFIDLKFGKGVRVYASKNKQMMVYALGALERFSMLYDIKRVRMTIYQPRLDHIDTFEMTVEELYEWARETLIPKARLAYAGEGPYAPGEHCRFCRAKLTCRANADFQLEIAKFDFKALDLLTDTELADTYLRYESFKNWMEGVTQFVLAEAVKGKEWPGLKLVEGKGKRSWKDEEAVIAKLLTKQYTLPDVTTTKLKGIGDITKLIGKRDFAVWLEKGNGTEQEPGGLVKEPKGKPTLVALTDPRPVYVASVEDDFKDFQNNEDD